MSTKVSTKFYISQLAIFTLFLVAMAVTYNLFSQQFQNHIDEMVSAKIAKKKTDFLSPIIKAEKKLIQRKHFFKNIHEDVITRYKNAPSMSLNALKRQTLKKYKLKDIDINIFLINRQHIIYDATFKKDIDLDIAAMWKPAAEAIDIAFSNNQIIMPDGVKKDPVDGYVKIYSYAKLNDETVLEVAFIDKEDNHFFKIMPNSEYYEVRKHKNNTYSYILPTKDSDNINKNISYKKNRKTFTEKNESNDLVGRALLKKGHVMIHKKKIITVYALITNDHLGDYFKNLVVKFDLDTTKQYRIMQTFKLFFLMVMVISILVLVLIYWLIKSRLVQPLGTIIEKIHNDKPLEESSFSSSDFIQVARVYNELREKLKKYSTKIAYHKGELAERKRIAHDLHDDLGGKLLHLSSQRGEYGEYARKTLQDLRTLTHALVSEDCTLVVLIADMRYQIHGFCDNANIELVFSSDIAESIADKRVSAQTFVSFSCILNELSRNAVQNASTNKLWLTFTADDENCVLSVENDGEVTNPCNWKQGLGMLSTERRVNQLGGSVIWDPRDNGGTICHAKWKTSRNVLDYKLISN